MSAYPTTRSEGTIDVISLLGLGAGAVWCYLALKHASKPKSKPKPQLVEAAEGAPNPYDRPDSADAPGVDERPSTAKVRTTIHQLVRAYESHGAREQKIAWYFSTWISGLKASVNSDDVWSRVLKDIRGDSADDRCWISRSDLVRWSRVDVEHLFLATMIWGFGKTGYGAHRVRLMVDTPEFSTILGEIVEAVRSQGAAAGYTKLWRYNRARIHELGVAFGTKLLHAASLGFNVSPQPLVFDSNVEKALAELNPFATRLRASTLSARQYHQYCAWAESSAAEGGATPEDVEYALFSWGVEL